MWSRTFSSVPNFWRSSAAVLSPMPGTPGMLSLVSPFSPMKSGISSGGIPYRSITPSRSYTRVSVIPREVVMIFTTPSSTSWYASRSPVTTMVGMGGSALRAFSTIEAITSSAS